MAEEIDENEFFHEDYTTASEWEVFIHRLSAVLTQEFCDQQTASNDEVDDLNTCDWSLDKHEIYFANILIEMQIYKASGTPGSSKKTQSSFIRSKCRVPIPNYFGFELFIILEPKTEGLSESQLKILLSSVQIALDESGVDKIPIFIADKRKNRCFYFGVSRELSRRTNYDVIILDEIPPTFKFLSGILSIFKNKTKALPNPVCISTQMSYSINVETELFESSVSGTSYFVLPYGVSGDPIKKLTLKCTWQEIMENVMIDSVNYSDLDPQNAPLWAITFQQEKGIHKPTYFLSECLENFLKLKNNNRTVKNITAVSDDYLNDDKIKYMFSYLFPEEIYKYSDNWEWDKQYQKHPIKSVPVDSLVTRLCCLIATINSSMGGIYAVAFLWLCFTEELKKLYRKSVSIPGILSSGNLVDNRTCLLHQKLQILNICIEKKKVREGKVPNLIAEDSEEEDEFYDCPEDEDKNVECGRLKRLDKESLLRTDEPLYIPICQEIGPKSEDQLIMDIINSETELALLSDMESFKAANPHGEFEDFIRWHSPKDWTEDHTLSPRMKLADNSWLKMWEKAEARTAKEQEPLFDFEKMAMEIIEYLKNLTIGQVCTLSLPPLVHSVISKIENESESIRFTERFQKKYENLAKITNNEEGCGLDWSDIVYDISTLDALIIQSKNLSAKLAKSDLDFDKILCLLNNQEIELISKSEKNVFSEILGQTAGKTFNEVVGEPFKKEYVLNCRNKNNNCHHSLRVILKEDLTICGGFSEDTIFSYT